MMLGTYYEQLERERNLPPGTLSKIRAVESSNGTKLQNPNSSAGGDFQFIDSTAKSMGLQNRFDPVASAKAAADLAAKNRDALVQGGVQNPGVGDLYVAHQQGANGYLKLAQGIPTAGMAGNGGKGMAPQDFLQMWKQKAENAQPGNLGEAGALGPTQAAAARGYMNGPAQYPQGSAGAPFSATEQGPGMPQPFLAQDSAGAPVRPPTPAPATPAAGSGGLVGALTGNNTSADLKAIAGGTGASSLGGFLSGISKLAQPTQTARPAPPPLDTSVGNTPNPALMAYLDPRKRQAGFLGG